MPQGIRFALLAAVIAVCAGCHQQTVETVQSVKFDDREWTAVQKTARKRAGGDYVREYLPPGQTATDWREIVTVEEFSTAMAKQPISAGKFQDQVVQELKKDDPNLAWSPVSSGDNDLMFSWKGSDKKLGNAKGLVRIVAQPRVIDVVQYTTREQFSDEQSHRWQDILSHTDASKL